jgi:hypothetical protein
MMPHYRIYLLASENKIVSAHDEECEDDEAALSKAAELQGEHAGFEIWCGLRLLCCFIE